MLTTTVKSETELEEEELIVVFTAIKHSLLDVHIKQECLRVKVLP